LQRFHADPHLLRLKNWVLVDPRREYRTSPFHYLPLPVQKARTEPVT
jgi:hypothetical protein